MQVKFEVTLARLRKEGACVDGYNKVVRMLQGKPFDDADSKRDSYIRFAHKKPINLLAILDSNGVDDCLWALRAVDHPDCGKVSRFIACDCAEAVLHLYEDAYPGDPRPRNAIAVARRFANGEATDDERDAAWAAARAAAGAAAWDAAWAAARAAAGAAAWDAAWDAAWAAARAAAGAAAWDAAWDAARAAARAAQSKIIRSYLSSVI